MPEIRTPYLSPTRHESFNLLTGNWNDNDDLVQHDTISWRDERQVMGRQLGYIYYRRVWIPDHIPDGIQLRDMEDTYNTVVAQGERLGLPRTWREPEEANVFPAGYTQEQMLEQEVNNWMTPGQQQETVMSTDQTISTAYMGGRRSGVTIQELGGVQPDREIEAMSMQAIASTAHAFGLQREYLGMPPSAFDPEIKKRAEELLLSILNKEQQAEYMVNGTISLVGSNGNLYRLEANKRQGNITEVSHPAKRIWCAHIDSNLPDADNLAAQVLWLQTNADEFIGQANLYNTTPQLREPNPQTTRPVIDEVYENTQEWGERFNEWVREHVIHGRLEQP